MNRPLILASGSPRRREILTDAGLPFTVLVTEADETLPAGLSPEESVKELSLRKAKAALRLADAGAVVLAADTMVAAVKDGKEITLGKPQNEAEAKEMLRLLSGTTHRVLTGITLTDGHRTITDAVSTEVHMRIITEEELERYVATGSPLDKAGAYGVQEHAGLFVTGITGDYFNVVGLPLCRVGEILSENFGFAL